MLAPSALAGMVIAPAVRVPGAAVALPTDSSAALSRAPSVPSSITAMTVRSRRAVFHILLPLRWPLEGRRVMAESNILTWHDEYAKTIGRRPPPDRIDSHIPERLARFFVEQWREDQNEAREALAALGLVRAELAQNLAEFEKIAPTRPTPLEIYQNAIARLDERLGSP